MATASDILRIARAEIGTKENPANSNKVKYNTAYYGRAVSGDNYAWCAVFIWWCFQQAGAASLYFGGGKTAYCPTLMSYHKAQAVKGDYQPGDIVFFNFDGGKNAQHVGVCESYNGSTITTIDGNTGTGSEANGGAVMRRTRDKKYIVGAYRPDYAEGEIMTQDQFNAMAEQWLNQRAAAQPTQKWEKDAVAKAKATGVSDGTCPMGIPTRVQVMAMCSAAVEAAKKG